MSTHDTNKNGHLIIFRSADWYRGLSPKQMQQVADDWMAWFNRLKDEGKCAGGNPLEREGKIVSGANRIVSDGPFAESKETIAGYFLLTVNTLEEAVRIAKDCPGLPYGVRVEVRPIAPQCPMVDELAAKEPLAYA
ncbi:MAG: hypothetical protein KIS67_07445 [Verrucomicrobiae bacterium]|nr:hypothetical protein [Verrucomicrobiae bacterium]